MVLSRPLVLGSLRLKSRAMLSPLESVSDVGFRKICFDLGGAFTWTEMVRAQSIIRNNASALDLMDTHDEMTPTGIQLLAKCPDELARALRHIEHLANTTRPHFKNIMAVDLNFGCPSPSVISEGGGPALLKRKSKLLKIFQALSSWKKDNSLKNVGAVGVKIRLGLNSLEQNSRVYMNVIESANLSGLDYIAVHARHAKQKSSDMPTWSAIKEIKDVAEMPVIGNGNVSSVSEAHRMMLETGCDGVMIARAAIRNPWIFSGFSSTHAEHSDSDNALGTSPNFNFNIEEPWPTMEQVDAAETQYFESVKLSESKEKFSKFHRINFERLRNSVRTGNKSLLVGSPKTIHL